MVKCINHLIFSLLPRYFTLCYVHKKLNAIERMCNILTMLCWLLRAMFGFLVNTPQRDAVTVRQCVCYVPLFAQRARPGLARNTAAARNYVCTIFISTVYYNNCTCSIWSTHIETRRKSFVPRPRILDLACLNIYTSRDNINAFYTAIKVQWEVCMNLRFSFTTCSLYW